jgi:CMP/dCMP kinase
VSPAAPVLAIDGPSGAGKGTISRAVAKMLGWHYLDSGAIYRSLAIAVGRDRVPLDDEQSIVQVANQLELVFRCDDQLTVLLDGEDITGRTQSESCGNDASKIAAYGLVREALLHKQRAFQQPPGLVADGRDMGTVVFPQAEYKIFLTASSDVRAERRYKQLKEKGIDVSLKTIRSELDERDQRDTARSHAPLAMADDAVLIDTSELTIEEVIERVVEVVGG